MQVRAIAEPAESSSPPEAGIPINVEDRAAHDARDEFLDHTPSAAVRSEYLTYVIRTPGGRTVRGIMEQEDTGAVTIVDSSFQKTRIVRSDIRSMEVAPESLMPEDLLNALNPQELCDLFRYLQQESP